MRKLHTTQRKHSKFELQTISEAKTAAQTAVLVTFFERQVPILHVKIVPKYSDIAQRTRINTILCSRFFRSRKDDQNRRLFARNYDSAFLVAGANIPISYGAVSNHLEIILAQGELSALYSDLAPL